LYRLEKAFNEIFSRLKDYRKIKDHLRKLQNGCQTGNSGDLEIYATRNSAIHFWGLLNDLQRHMSMIDGRKNRYYYLLSDVNRTKGLVLERIKMDNEAFARNSILTCLRELFVKLGPEYGFECSEIYHYLAVLETKCIYSDHSPSRLQAASSEIRSLSFLQRDFELHKDSSLRGFAAMNFLNAVRHQATTLLPVWLSYIAPFVY